MSTDKKNSLSPTTPGMSVFLACFLVFPAFLAAPVYAQDNRDSGENKVVYGTDDRIDVYQETDSARLSWAQSVCALVSLSDLFDNRDGTYSLYTEPFTVAGKPPCSGEPFSTQPTAAFCTGFMASSDLIVTAGHCLTEEDLLSMAFVFGFEMLGPDRPRLEFEYERVYFGVELIAYQYTPTLDYAVVRVDREITSPGAAPLPMRQTGSVARGTQVGIIGHPTGLPKKLAFGSNTLVRGTNEPFFFFTNVDAFAGNSGSPVFNAATGVVEGILVRGNKDYNVGYRCFEVNRLSNETSSPEAVTRSITFASDVYNVNIPPSNDDCENAILLEVNEYYTGTTRASSPDYYSSCGRRDLLDVWHLFIPEDDDGYLFSFGVSSFDMTVSLFTGSCGRLEELDCRQIAAGGSEAFCVPLDAYTPLYIRIAGNNGTTGNYILDISAGADCDEPACGGGNGFDLAGLMLMSMMFMTLFLFSAMKSVDHKE